MEGNCQVNNVVLKMWRDKTIAEKKKKSQFYNHKLSF